VLRDVPVGTIELFLDESDLLTGADDACDGL
jgi:hypothetical protein